MLGGSAKIAAFGDDGVEKLSEMDSSSEIDNGFRSPRSQRDLDSHRNYKITDEHEPNHMNTSLLKQPTEIEKYGFKPRIKDYKEAWKNYIKEQKSAIAIELTAKPTCQEFVEIQKIENDPFIFFSRFESH